MANYYVSTTRGDDSTGNGSAVTPWKTINKAIGSSPAITLSGTGDTLYIEPGVYREVVTLGLSPTSGGRLTIQGDFDGSGFLLGGGPGVTGLVDWRGWSNETTLLTTSPCLYSIAKSYVTLSGIKFMGSGYNPGSLRLEGVWSDWIIQDCILVGNMTAPYCLWAFGTAGSAANLIIRRCTVVSYLVGIGLQLTFPTHSAEYDTSVLIQNSMFIGCNSAVRFTPSGAAAFNPTGMQVQNCSFFWAATAGVESQLSASITNTVPLKVYGSYFLFGRGVQSLANTSHILEDGNIFYCTSPRTNVNAGSNSITTASPAININDERIGAAVLRPFGEPLAGTSMMAFGGYGTPPTVDLFNQPRPTTISAGALEHDTFAGGTTTINIFQVEA